MYPRRKDHSILYPEPAPPYYEPTAQLSNSPHNNPYNGSFYPREENREHFSFPSLGPSQTMIGRSSGPETAFFSGTLAPQSSTRSTSHNNWLQTPIAIPQIQAGMGQSFVRVWAPVLHDHRISKEEFVAFIDNLNVVATANPPLQIVDLAGGILGLVPHHWAVLAGQALQVTAKVGTHALSKGRTEAYMRDANENMFKPRALKVSIASTDAVTALLRIPTSTPILAPLGPQTMNMSTAERFLLGMQSYNSVLDFNVPPPAEQTTTLGRISAKQVAAQSKKQQKKLVKDREKIMEEEQEEAEKELEKQQKKARERQKKEEKRAKKRSKGKESDSDSDTDEERSGRKSHDDKDKKKLSKEEKKAQKLLWLVVENL